MPDLFNLCHGCSIYLSPICRSLWCPVMANVPSCFKVASFMLHIFLPFVFYIFFLVVGVLVVNASRRNEPVGPGVVKGIISVLSVVGVLGVASLFVIMASRDKLCFVEGSKSSESLEAGARPVELGTMPENQRPMSAMRERSSQQRPSSERPEMWARQ